MTLDRLNKNKHSLPKPVGLLWLNALLCCEKRPPPVLVLPKRLVVVPPGVPNPNPVLVEDVTGWLKVLEPKRPPGNNTLRARVKEYQK